MYYQDAVLDMERNSLRGVDVWEMLQCVYVRGFFMQSFLILGSQVDFFAR